MPGASGSGIASPACQVADNTECAMDGSTNEVIASGVKYDSSTGKFEGEIIGNFCANHEYRGRAHTSSCKSHTIPSVTEEAPSASPMLGAVAVSIYSVNIFGPFEAGFTDGQVCDGGTCSGGIDVPTCDDKLHYECEEGAINEVMLLDSCGGHAVPYHYHLDLACLYNTTNTDVHSPMTGYSFDGYGIYGTHEGNGKPPALDSCNGHYGQVPSNDGLPGDGPEVPSSCVYHYHMSDEMPFTIGCYGPVATERECLEVVYGSGSRGCGSGFEAFTTDKGTIEYDLWCPCGETDAGATDEDNACQLPAGKEQADETPALTGAPTQVPTQVPTQSPGSQSERQPSISPTKKPSQPNNDQQLSGATDKKPELLMALLMMAVMMMFVV